MGGNVLAPCCVRTHRRVETVGAPQDQDSQGACASLLKPDLVVAFNSGM